MISPDDLLIEFIGAVLKVAVLVLGLLMFINGWTL